MGDIVAVGAFARAVEKETKFLLVDGHIPDIFLAIEKHLDAERLIRGTRTKSHLITLQLDTLEGALAKKGNTLRIRAECGNYKLSQLKRVDVCLKTRPVMSKTGELSRGEYEEEIPDTDRPYLERLLEKYPENQYPEVHAALRGVCEEDLRITFRIDCHRYKFKVEVPSDEYADKKVYMELCLDDLLYFHSIPDLIHLPYDNDGEVEYELILQPCTYDPDPDKAKYVSSYDLTDMDRMIATQKMNEHLIYAAELAGGTGALQPNTLSKARRGSNGLKKQLEAGLKNYISPRTVADTSSRLQSAFVLANGQSLNDLRQNAARPIILSMEERAWDRIEHHNPAHPAVSVA